MVEPTRKFYRVLNVFTEVSEKDIDELLKYLAKSKGSESCQELIAKYLSTKYSFMHEKYPLVIE